MNDTGIIKKYLSLIDKDNKFFIDIGCSYEFNIPEEDVLDSEMSIFFECDLNKISRYKKWENNNNFKLFTERVTPNNIISLIESVSKNKTPKLIDIDIDSYDWFVLNEILKSMRPTIIVAEINEKIPPPIKFTVKYDEHYSWDCSHYYGMSISKVEELFNKYEYEIIDLSYNNVYAVAKEKNPNLPVYSAKEAYDKFYKNTDWRIHFNYNADVAHWMDMNEKDAEQEIKTFFSKNSRAYELYI